ncbi:MAG: response regulator transcription factor [Methylovirgula sp.]
MSGKPIISIVDDDASVRAAMECLVRSVGFVACGFASAEAFLNSPQLDETACLITDVAMPGMDGLQLQSRLQASGHCVPTIFVTAFPKEIAKMRAEAAGALAFLEKPFDGDTIVKILRQALDCERA